MCVLTFIIATYIVAIASYLCTYVSMDASSIHCIAIFEIFWFLPQYSAIYSYMVQHDCYSVIIPIASYRHPTSTDHMVHCVEHLVEVRHSGFVKAKLIIA